MFKQSEKLFTIYSLGSLLATILVLPGEYQSVPKPAERLKGRFIWLTNSQINAMFTIKRLHLNAN